MDVIVIGLGSMGKRRIRLLKKFDLVENIIGVDKREDRRDDVKKNYGCDVYESIEEAVRENSKIESAFICTSPLSHNKIISEVLGYKLNVFTELNLISDGYEENIKLAKENNKVLFLSSTFFYRDEIRFLRNKLEKKIKLNYIYHIGQYLPDWHPWENYKDFFIGDKRTNGCREIMAIEFPWLLKTFGEIKSYNVIADKITELDIDYKDNFMIQIEHINGNKGTLVVDVVSPKAVRNLEIYGENTYYSWKGTRDSLEYFDINDKKMKKVDLNEEIEHLKGYENFVIENAYQNEIKEFFNVILGISKSEYGFEEDLEVLNLIDKLEGKSNE